MRKILASKLNARNKFGNELGCCCSSSVCHWNPEMNKGGAKGGAQETEKGSYDE